MADDTKDWRSRRWFTAEDLRAFGHRSRAKQAGWDEDDWENRPIVGIINTWSDINPCHVHFRARAESVKHGILQAGGMPVELPAVSLAETFVKPTTMLYRNFLAMETEELIRKHPVDGVVLMGGCDKTGPALVMGAVSAGVPAIFFPSGPMIHGTWRGARLGSGSDTWKYWAEKRAGTITDADWAEIEGGIARSFGHCMTMGTASTMTSALDAMGLILTGGSSILAPDSAHVRLAKATGRRAVGLIEEGVSIGDILTPAAIRNGVRAVLALGGSTNAVVHMIALGRRAGYDLTLAEFDALSRDVPVLANVRPTGSTYLMEDFFEAGGLRGLLSRIEDLLEDAPTVGGLSLKAGLEGAHVQSDDVIRPRDNPVVADSSLAVLTGNLAPNGAVIKPGAMDQRFREHTGPAIVFDDYDHMESRIDDPDLPVTADSVLVLRNAGPVGGPGMPEWGMLPIPKKLLQQGVRDMLRLSDARMSGTSYGACVLHIAPESAVGGPLALVEEGDMISIDVAARTLTLEVDDAVLATRRAAWTAPPPHYGRGYGWLAAKHITQADAGCDFDFLETGFGQKVPEPAIH
ncbi:MAG: L-arabinonate dehydratase [Devosia sp.]